MELEWDLGPTQDAYIFSDAIINAIISNTGEGKTFASVVAMIIHAQRLGRPALWAIVRDTHENIKTSTARSIEKVFAKYPRAYKFKDDYHRLVIYSKPRVEADLFGIADLASLGRLQGPEYDGIWLEEPAPMTETNNAGLREEVYSASLVRCARGGDRPRLQISMNPAEDDHWTHKRLLEEPDFDPANPLITKKVFMVPYGENKYVTEESRQAVKAAYANDPASYMRYVEGKFAPIYKGKKVTPAYNPLIHLSADPLIPAFGLVGWRLWDGWHNPVCILGQTTVIGRQVAIDTLRLEGGDIRTLIRAKVKPLLESPRWKGKCRDWRDIGDRSMMDPDQSNVEMSAAKVIEDELDTSFEPGPSRFQLIKQGMGRALNMMIQGLPAVMVNRGNRVLHRALDGAWHFKTDPSGNIIGMLPEKDEVSHVGDAWGNGICVLLPVLTWHRKDLAKIRKAAERSRNRAASYGKH
jgi:hypothetical protein